MHNSSVVLVISFSDLKKDPRVYRQLHFLKNFKSVKIYTAGFGDPQIEGIEFIELKHKFSQFSRVLNAFRLKMWRFEQYYWSSFLVQDALGKLKHLSINIVIANDLESLPLALELGQIHESKIYLDAHEYTPRQFEDRWSFRFFFRQYWDYIAKQYLPEVDAMTTVCEGISQEYKKVYGVESQVITNAPYYESLLPQKVDPDHIKIIHHGLITKSRKLEKMVMLMDLLDDRFSLDLMLVTNNPESLRKLKLFAQGRPKVKFRDPVEMLDIPKVVNQYDIGLCLFSPISFNLKMTLPNKLFEFIQGRVAVATWPSQEIKNIVEEYSCGVVSDEFTIMSMANILNALTAEQIQTLKSNSDQAAKELCADTNFWKMREILSGLGALDE